MRDLAGSVAQLRALWAENPHMHKTPDDLARYQHLIDTVRPYTIVETGLLHGGSAEWFAARAPQVVVIENNPAEIALFDPPANVTIVEGHSHHVADRVADLVAGAWPVMVILDSDHGTDNVHQEAELYGPLVTPGSYMVIEDGILGYIPVGPRLEGNWFDGDPHQAALRFLAEHPDDWTVDTELEDRWPTTQHPHGWLRRR